MRGPPFFDVGDDCGDFFIAPVGADGGHGEAAVADHPGDLGVGMVPSVHAVIQRGNDCPAVAAAFTSVAGCTIRLVEDLALIDLLLGVGGVVEGSGIGLIQSVVDYQGGDAQDADD